LNDSGANSLIWCKNPTDLPKLTKYSFGGMKHVMKIHPEGLIPARPVISFDRIIAHLNEDKDGYLPEIGI